MKTDDVNRLIEQRQALAHEALDEMVAENQRLGLYDTHNCKTHPDAPHGFDRNASHSADRYVCECEGWEPVDNVDISEECVHKTDKSIHEPLYMDMSQVPTGMPDWKPGMVFPAPKKEWVGLTPTEFNSIKDTATTIGYAITKTEAMLKEKNT